MRRFFGMKIPWILILLSLIFLSGCSVLAAPAQEISATIRVDGQEITVKVAPQTSIQTALKIANVTMNPLDRVEPPSFTTMIEDTVIKVIRVTEQFEVEENIIPFEIQTVRNESLPESIQLLIQPGTNGLEQITYRKVFEDGLEVSKTLYKSEVITKPVPEITMIGIQNPFTSTPIDGKIAYLTAGNAWIMETSTGNRKPVVMTGDLDGRVFELSFDGRFLLFSRKLDPAEGINSLYVVNVESDNPQPINLKVRNVIHHAAWIPGRSLRISFSTVEPRETAPGWQANNDLYILPLTDVGAPLDPKNIVETNSGGIYGWWGTEFSWSPDGQNLWFSRPDAVGIVDLETGELIPVINIIPYDTKAQWAWISPVSWGASSDFLLYVNHQSDPDSNQARFDLNTLLVQENISIKLAEQTGMFAYPSISAKNNQGKNTILYLQAAAPDQSDSSLYQVWIMDRDGSNRRRLFPNEGSGIEPQRVVWGPPASSNNNHWVALLHQGNLILVDTDTSKTIQVTADGSISRIDWK